MLQGNKGNKGYNLVKWDVFILTRDNEVQASRNLTPQSLFTEKVVMEILNRRHDLIEEIHHTEIWTPKPMDNGRSKKYFWMQCIKNNSKTQVPIQY